MATNSFLNDFLNRTVPSEMPDVVIKAPKTKKRDFSITTDSPKRVAEPQTGKKGIINKIIDEKPTRKEVITLLKEFIND